jgi:hypothetical protein
MTLSVATRRSRRRAILATLGVGVGIGAVGLARLDRSREDPSRRWHNAGRSQTAHDQWASGVPAISGDGKGSGRIEPPSCDASGCTFGVELQDVGSTASRRLFDRASGVLRYRVERRRPQPPRRRHDQ